ncbi:MAG: aminotransferase class I/II-fold pyridoxal phosphate-dependent enzyme [Candidatus Altiarchaeales archaeon]|nr:aminotransferase class I/II-fold pyridoxal phosphate-dependent enzyme [Candidatus Altiarchaeales archaeon]MBD3416735.1 aminotransferase class I/II-fold pyridoxal phosphate-dependent enzyme [Candidatus Altiarchaeales archaeon]
MDVSFYRSLAEVDPRVLEAIGAEERRQEGINLIASESLTSQAVREACSSVMTNKYAEGYPHKRYYGGCENVDLVEDLAIERAKKVFGADHVNVQPHSGTQANLAVYLAALKPGDKILSMELSHGGHLSHGYKINESGKIYKGEFYTVSKETGVIEYDEVLARAREVKPQIIVCGYSAYPRTVPFKEFREIADDVGALLLADIAHIAGLVAAGVHPSPVRYADYITTTTHKTLMGPRGAMIMCREEHAKDVDRAVFPGCQGGPFMHIIAAKAVCFKENMTSERKKVMEQVVKNSKAMASTLSDNGFDLVSGGTDNHLILADLSNKGLTGKLAEESLGAAGITLNKNTVPYDNEKPFVTSGIRVGTPSVTVRGMGESEMNLIGSWISEVLSDPSSEKVRDKVKAEVGSLCSKFPVYK